MDCFASESFEGIMQTTILPAAQQKPIVLFAGDVGAWANLTPYYEQRPDAALTMVMTGLGDNPNNAGILVTVDGNKVQMEVYSFTGQPVLSLETYSPSYWLQQVAPCLLSTAGNRHALFLWWMAASPNKYAVATANPASDPQ